MAWSLAIMAFQMVSINHRGPEGNTLKKYILNGRKIDKYIKKLSLLKKYFFPDCFAVVSPGFLLILYYFGLQVELLSSTKPVNWTLIECLTSSNPILVPGNFSLIMINLSQKLKCFNIAHHICSGTIAWVAMVI